MKVISTVVSLDTLTKQYGSSRGVADLTFTVDEGRVIGFLGPNGAGKSTTINVLLGYLQPSSGNAHIFGKDITKHGVDIRMERSKRC